MLNNTCLYLDKHFQGKIWSLHADDGGKLLADVWTKEKNNAIDLWSVSYFGEEFINAFLQRVLEIEGNLKEVDDIKWYYGCETFNFGLPLYFRNTIWIKNFLSKEKIELGLDELSLQMMAECNNGYYDGKHEELNGILKEIEIDENGQIKNAKYISNKIISLKYCGVVQR